MKKRHNPYSYGCSPPVEGAFVEVLVTAQWLGLGHSSSVSAAPRLADHLSIHGIFSKQLRVVSGPKLHPVKLACVSEKNPFAHLVIRTTHTIASCGKGHRTAVFVGAHCPFCCFIPLNTSHVCGILYTVYRLGTHHAGCAGFSWSTHVMCARSWLASRTLGHSSVCSLWYFRHL